MAAVYFNVLVLVLVLVVQLFVKTPPLAQLAPTQAEPPFAITQALVLLVSVWLGCAASTPTLPADRRSFRSC